MTQRFIKVVVPSYEAVRAVPELRGARFFIPVQLLLGEIYGMVDPESLPNAYGFDTFEEAYRVIQDAEEREASDEAAHYSDSSSSRGDREDFHADL